NNPLRRPSRGADLRLCGCGWPVSRLVQRAPRGIRGRIRIMGGPTQKYSITMPRDVAEAARARSGPAGLSAYVTAAVARQIERDNLNELIAVAEAEHGPITDQELQAKRDALRALEQQGASDPDTT